MGMIIGFIGATVGGAIGWWLGERMGVMTAFILSTIGSGIGVYFARRVAKEYLP